MLKGDARRRYRRIAAAGIIFQGGAAMVDPGTIVATLVNALTGSAFAVGAAAGIARFGWLFPQLFVAYAASRRQRRMPLYLIGAAGRIAILLLIALLLMQGADQPTALVVGGFFLLWTVYSFVGGIVAVPYNDIVGRSVPSSSRSRLLATRFFGGGILALLAVVIAHRLLAFLPFSFNYAAVLLLGAVLLLISTLSFYSLGEPLAPAPPDQKIKFGGFLRDGIATIKQDARFRLFVFAQWLGGGVTMAVPFYILQAMASGARMADAATLLGAQTVGALCSNPLWGWWGDHRGKQNLLELAAGVGLVAPLLTLVWLLLYQAGGAGDLLWFALVFFVLGAASNGSVIAVLGYLMEISPDARRPAYSGYFNVMVAPAALLPMAGALVAETTSYATVFAISSVAALLQLLAIRRLRRRS